MLYLTYNNTIMTDGAGAQLQRIMGIYLLSKYYNVGYIHRGLTKLSYQGVKCLENNTDDNSQIEIYNALFNFQSTDESVIIHKEIKCEFITDEYINKLIYENKNGNNSENTLLIIQFAHSLIDRNTQILLYPLKFEWLPSCKPNPIIIAVHVRRGELFVVESNRMLPNSYYIECMKSLASILTHANIPYDFHLHTEIITKPTVITPEHHGILNRISHNITLTPEDNKIEDFNVIPNIKYRINEDSVETLKALSSANILLASRSSFSYVAATLQKGVVLFHPFWHGLSPAWIPTRSGQDVLNASDKILKGCV